MISFCHHKNICNLLQNYALQNFEFIKIEKNFIYFINNGTKIFSDHNAVLCTN